jgi:hypothetical protein
MSVAVMKRDTTDGTDPRAGLRQAIAEAAKAHHQAERHAEAIHRAENMVTVAEAKLHTAGEALEAVREEQAEVLAHAASTGTTQKSTGMLKAARAALSDAEDEAVAARRALERLEAGGDDLRARRLEIENAVLVEIGKVIASTVAGPILALIERRQIELQALRSAFTALTDDETVEIPFRSDVQKLNAKGARRAPVQGLRDRFFNLDPGVGQQRAREVATACKKFRSELAANPDLREPPDLLP